MVFKRILVSSHRLHSSMYWRSSLAHSLKSVILLRPVTCQMQVIPGRIERRRRMTSTNRLMVLSRTGKTSSYSIIVGPATRNADATGSGYFLRETPSGIVGAPAKAGDPANRPRHARVKSRRSIGLPPAGWYGQAAALAAPLLHPTTARFS